MVLPEASDEGGTQRTGRVHASTGEASLGRTRTSTLPSGNIIKQARFRPPHPQQHSSRVGESHGQIPWFRALPPPLLLHREDGEDHLEGAQHLHAQSLSRMQLQGDLGREQRAAEGR